MYSPSDPEWKRAETQRWLGVVRYGDQEVEIVADDWYNDATKRNKLPSASDRDALIEQAVIPVLQATNPEHLKGLAWIRFDGVKGGNASGNYLAFSNENITDPKKIGGITITAWHEYVGRDNAAGLRYTLKHELGHHVWEATLNDADRAAYAQLLEIEFSGPKALTFRFGDSDVLGAVYDTRIAKALSLTGGTAKYGGYGDTNIFENFAEFYKGFNFLSGALDTEMVHGDSYWDSYVELNEFDADAFTQRLGVLPLDRLLIPGESP
jgi:hypothetical protein